MDINIISQFRGENYFLSNFYPCEIEFRGILYPSVEHAYMSAKNDSLWWKSYCSDINVSAADVKTRSRSIELVENWDDNRLNLMEELLQYKFSKEPCKSKLLNTGEAIIEEGNNWNDVYWGICLKTGLGENHLGKIIMKIRTNLRDEYER